MKKVILLVISLILLIIPDNLNAKEIKSLNLAEALQSENIEPLYKTYKENKSQVTIYLFRGKGESKSVQFLNYLNSIYEEYGDFFKLVSYEIGENSANSKLMDNTIDYLNSDVITVPFIIIGDIHFITYEEDLNENILKAIVSEYESKKKTDIIEEVLLKYYRDYDLIIGVILFIVILLFAFMVYASIKNKKLSLDVSGE